MDNMSKCKLCPPESTIEEELFKLVTEDARRGRPLPRFVLVGFNTFSRLHSSLRGDCPKLHMWDDLTVATPVGMVAIAVDETRPHGMLCVYHAKNVRVR